MGLLVWLWFATYSQFHLGQVTENALNWIPCQLRAKWKTADMVSVVLVGLPIQILNMFSYPDKCFPSFMANANDDEIPSFCIKNGLEFEAFVEVSYYWVSQSTRTRPGLHSATF